MTTHLTVPGFIVKWIVIPGIVMAAGYFLVGPRIGKSNVQPQQAPAPLETSQPATAPNSPSLGSATQTAAPSSPAPSASTSPGTASSPPVTPLKPHKRRRASAPVSSSSENFPQTQPDEGSTGSESQISK